MSITTERREQLKSYLLEFSHYDKSRIIRGAKNRGIFGDNQDDNQVYDAIVKFSEHHNIKIHTEPPIEMQKCSDKFVNEFIESVDEDGNSNLKKLNFKEDNSNEYFIKTLELEAENLSNKLIRINKLIKVYKNEDNI